MDRRSFIVGSGAVLTTAFVAKANWYIRNKNAFKNQVGLG
jgi:hypothetical protein